MNKLRTQLLFSTAVLAGVTVNQGIIHADVKNQQDMLLNQ